MIQKFLSNEDGATAIEYGLITALIAVGIILSLTTLRDNMNNVLGYISEILKSSQ